MLGVLKKWVKNGYNIETSLEKQEFDSNKYFLCFSIEKFFSFYVSFKFLNLVKFEEVYKSSKMLGG